MQAAAYTITPHEAQIIRELVDFLGEDVFDQRRQNGVIAKSDTFLRKITEARGVIEQLRADAPR